MKILYHHRVASKDGQYVHIEEIIGALRKLGHEVLIVAPRGGQDQAFGGDGGLVPALKQRIPKFIYELMEFSYTFFAAAKLWWLVRKHKPDFIYERFNVFHPGGVWVQKITGLPLILEVNSPLYEERAKHDGVSLRALARWSQSYVWRQANAVLPVTQVLADHLITYGVEPEAMTVVHNGINAEDFMAQRPQAAVPLDTEGKLVIGFVGFCREWHGLDKVLDLLTQTGNENLFFLVVGDGPAVPALRTHAERAGLQNRMHITGVVQREDMPEWLTPIDIALQPSVVAYASPLKMLEYMATGKAIVAPDQANIRELLTHEHNALLFQPDNQVELLNACNRLASDKQLRERLSENARRSVIEKRLFWDSNAERIIEIAETLIAEKAG